MKKIAIIAAAVLAAGAAQAQSHTAATLPVYGELGYAFTTIEAGGKVHPGTLRGIVGWDVNQYVALEAMLGTNINDDSIAGYKYKISRTYGFYVKPKYAINSQFEVFARLGFADTKIKESYAGASYSDSDNDFSWGVGANYSFTKKIYGSVDYTSYYSKDGVKINGATLAVGYRF